MENGEIKMYGLLPKRPDITEAQFHRHWSTIHRDHALKIRRMRRYVQSHRTDGTVPGIRRIRYDGVPECWYDNLDAALGMRQDPDYTENAFPDEPNFSDMATKGYVMTRTRLLSGPTLDRDTSAIKAIIMVRRRPEYSVDDFQDRWWSFAENLEDALPSVMKTAASVTDARTYDPDGRVGIAAPEFDGFAEAWWTDRSTFDRSWSQAGESVLASLEKLADLDASAAGLFEELHVIWPSEQ